MTSTDGDRRVGAVLGPSRPQRVRYWPTGIDPPRLPDGTVDIRALCRLYDDHCNRDLSDHPVPGIVTGASSSEGPVRMTRIYHEGGWC